MTPDPQTASRDPASGRWLLLIHQIPPKPDYLRVKIGRRLQRVGAMAVKNSVYVLPETEQALEDFQWIRTEIVDGGGDAVICRADFVDGLSDEGVRALFREARAGEYLEIATAAGALGEALDDRDADIAAGRPRAEDELRRLEKRLSVVGALDFFDAPEGQAARDAITAARSRLRPKVTAPTVSTTVHAEFRGRVWVTREGIFVDRIASAWLIARFIDPEARFKFVPARAYRPRKGELRFDMFEAEFTHEDDRCTFETLLARFGLDDPALGALGEVVHDIDVKDGKFGREDVAGIERVLAGIARVQPDDASRLERGRQLFDALYDAYAPATAEAAPAVKGAPGRSAGETIAEDR